MTCKTREEAERLEQEVRKAITETGTWPAPTTSSDGLFSGTLAEALAEAWSGGLGRASGWKHQRAGWVQRGRAQECIDILGPDRYCASITSEDFTALADKFRSEGASHATIRQKIQAFYRTLWHAKRKGWIDQRPRLILARSLKTRTFVFSESLETALIGYLRYEQHNLAMRDLFILGIETGMRLGELLQSRAGHWQLADRIVHVPPTFVGGRKGRNVTLTPRAIETITPWLRDRDQNDKLFIWTAAQVARVMSKARGFLGLQNNSEYGFNATLTTRAVRLAEQTRDVQVVAEQLGITVGSAAKYMQIAGV
jgi:integrase